MMYKIGSASSLLLDSRKIFLTVRKNSILFWEKIIPGLLMSAGLSFIGYNLSLVDEQERNGFSMLWGGGMVYVSLRIFYKILLVEYSEMDFVNNTFIRRKKIFNLTFQKTIITWPEGYSFKYSVFYDSYSRIDEIWLIVYTSEKEDSRMLARFFDKKTFLDFQKIFNENFPDTKIMEWHD